MKKVLLLVLSFAGLSAMAQTYTVDDTLSAGDSEFYYTADSNAVNLDGVTGAGVTWDYSSLTGYPGVTNLDTIKWASDSPDYGDFPSAVYHDDLNGGASVYFENFADSVVSYGFVFTIDGNLVKVMHDIDHMRMMDLPMSLNDSFTDSTYGNADVYGSAAATAGDVNVIADGTGTLNLGTSTFTNVIRIKMVETVETTITLPPPINTVTGTVTRTTYTYYDLANQNEAVLIHSTIDVASTLFNGAYSAVYSSVDLQPASVEENSIDAFDIYPNPATDIATITSDGADQLIIMNALGQSIVTINNPQSKVNIDVSDYQNGVYFIQLNKGEATKTKKLIVR